MADNRNMHRSARFGIAVAMLAILSAPVQAQTPQGVPAQPAQTPPAPQPQTLSDAYRLFYNARYEEAAALAMSLREGGMQDLENDEVRTSALLFQLRGLLNGQDSQDNDSKSDKGEVLKRCVRCPEVMAAFMSRSAPRPGARARQAEDESQRRRGALFSRQAGPQFRMARARAPRTQNRLGRILGSAQVTRCGVETEPESRPRSRRPRLDRLHRQYPDALGHALDTRRREQEARHRCRRRRLEDGTRISIRAQRRSSRSGTCMFGRRTSPPRPRSRKGLDGSFRRTTKSQSFLRIAHREGAGDWFVNIVKSKTDATIASPAPVRNAAAARRASRSHRRADLPRGSRLRARRCRYRMRSRARAREPCRRPTLFSFPSVSPKYRP